MKGFWKVAGIATLVAILGVTAVGAVVYAEDDDGAGWPFDFRERTQEAIAGILGINVATYEAAVNQAREQVIGEAVSEGWLTEDQADRMQERQAEHFGPRGMDKRFMDPRAGLAGDLVGHKGNSPIGIAAEELGISVRELMTELRGGKSFADLAGEKGVELEAISNAYLEQLTENLKTAVDDGRLTQGRADWMLEQAQKHVSDLLEGAWEGFAPGSFRGGHGPGRLEGFPGQTES
jgi:hypothetical protein